MCKPFSNNVTYIISKDQFNANNSSKIKFQIMTQSLLDILSRYTNLLNEIISFVIKAKWLEIK